MMSDIKGGLLFFLLLGCHQAMATDFQMNEKKDLNSASLTGSLWLNITVMASPCYAEHITPTRIKDYYHLNLVGCGNPLTRIKETVPLKMTVKNLNTHFLQINTTRIYDGQNTITLMAKGNDNVEVKINYQ